MAAYTDSLGFNKGSTSYPSNYANRLSVVEIDLDFRAIAAARAAAGVAALASTDTLVLCTLPKGSFVLNGSAVLLRAEGASANIDVGIGGGTVDFWVDGFDLNGTVGTVGGYADAAAYLCTADTNVLLTMNSSNVDVARVKIQLAVVNMGADQGTIPSA
jgi:hypothetical protein